MKMDHVYTKDELWAQLKALGMPRDCVVLVHTSLRLIGRVEGGAEALLDILIEYFTREGGLLCVPTHTWRNLKQEITLDVGDSATCLGAFSDLAAADPRGIRTENPTHSMAVFGNRERALQFAAGEIDVISGTSPDSCYGRLYDEGGYVLLVGVAHNRNTYLHAVSEILGIPNRITAERRTVKIRRASGEVVERSMHTHKTDYTVDISQRFPKYETAFRYHGAITDGRLGNAPVQACDARIMKETVELIWKNAGGEDPLADEKAILPRLYC